MMRFEKPILEELAASTGATPQQIAALPTAAELRGTYQKCADKLLGTLADYAAKTRAYRRKYEVRDSARADKMIVVLKAQDEFRLAASDLSQNTVFGRGRYKNVTQLMLDRMQGKNTSSSWIILPGSDYGTFDHLAYALKYLPRRTQTALRQAAKPAATQG